MPYLDEIALLATLAQDNSVKYYLVALGAEEPHPMDFALAKISSNTRVL
jgi:hypothetical protein